jgi:hypothetical protein
VSASCNLTIHVRNTADIAHQSAGLDNVAILIDRGHKVLKRQYGELWLRLLENASNACPAPRRTREMRAQSWAQAPCPACQHRAGDRSGRGIARPRVSDYWPPTSSFFMIALHWCACRKRPVFHRLRRCGRYWPNVQVDNRGPQPYIFLMPEAFAWIAIVDDDPSVLKALARLLRTRAVHSKTYNSAQDCRIARWAPGLPDPRPAYAGDDGYGPS